MTVQNYILSIFIKNLTAIQIMKKSLLLITFILNSSIFFSQQMPIEFNSSQDNFIGFDGSSFATRNDPSDGANKVGEFYNNGTNINQGFYLDVPVNTDNQKTITLSFFSFDPSNHNILLKLEDQNKTNIQVKETFSTTAAQSWQSVTFDFSNATNSSNGNSEIASGTYSRIAIFIDYGFTTPGTYLIDDISNGESVTNPSDLDVNYTDLVWSDEFNGSGAINASKWHHQTVGPNGGRWYNNEIQHYTDSETNSFISNGNLNIVAKKETKTQNNVSLDYTSARLNSKYAFTYGRVDVKAKLPSGNGTWPGIWTLGKNINEPGAYWQTQGFANTNWPACGEIDIMEHGLHSTNEVSSALHTPSSSGNTSNTASKMLADVANDFHVYSMNWSPNQITFLIDDIAYYTYKPSDQNDATWPFNKEQFLLLNIAMGGYSGTPDSNFTQSSMIIDYVRVYQNTSAAGINEGFNSKFSVFPNPASDLISIHTNKLIDKVELYSVMGQLVFTEENITKYISTQQIKSGLYLIKIYSNDKITTKKILITK